MGVSSCLSADLVFVRTTIVASLIASEPTSVILCLTFEPRCKKICIQGFQLGNTQTSQLSYRDKLENWNFACIKYTYDTFQRANNKGADQTSQMFRLVCFFVVRKPLKTGFLSSRSFWFSEYLYRATINKNTSYVWLALILFQGMDHFFYSFIPA